MLDMALWTIYPDVDKTHESQLIRFVDNVFPVSRTIELPMTVTVGFLHDEDKSMESLS